MAIERTLSIIKPDATNRNITGKINAIIEDYADAAERYADLPCLGYTHFQPAQPTTLGKRITLWLQDLEICARDLEGLLASRVKYEIGAAEFAKLTPEEVAAAITELDTDDAIDVFEDPERDGARGVVRTQRRLGVLPGAPGPLGPQVEIRQQGLGPLRVVPDAGLGEFQFYFGKAVAALVDVKDTPSARQCVPRCP